MCKYLLLLVVVFVPFDGIAKSCINADLQHFLRFTLDQEIEYLGDDVVSAGIVVMKVVDGKLLGDICLEVKDGNVVQRIGGNNQPITVGIERAVNYLAVVDRIGADFICDTGTGVYQNPTGEVVVDDNVNRGGYGLLSLSRILDVSNVGTALALEAAFASDSASYAEAIRETGIMLCEDGRKTVREMLSCISLIQQTRWINMIANQGHLVVNSTKPFFEVKSKGAVSSLSSAMVEACERGSCRLFGPDLGIKIAGLSDVNPEDNNGAGISFAFAFLPAQCPRFTIGIYVKKMKPVGRIIARNIMSKVIDHMVKNQLIIRDEASSTFLLHPAAR